MAWLDLLKGVPEAVGKYFTDRSAQKSAERIRAMELDDALHKRQVDLISQGLAADATWELEQIRNSGWKDEYVLLIVTLPLWLAFIDVSWLHGPAIVQSGFDAVAKTPGWYQFVMVSLILAVFGIRYWRKNQYDTVAVPPDKP